jgi:hypothetical protein
MNRLEGQSSTRGIVVSAADAAVGPAGVVAEERISHDTSAL